MKNFLHYYAVSLIWRQNQYENRRELVNKYIGIVFSARTRLDNGEPLDRGNVANQNINDESDDSDTE